MRLVLVCMGFSTVCAPGGGASRADGCRAAPADRCGQPPCGHRCPVHRQRTAARISGALCPARPVAIFIFFEPKSKHFRNVFHRNCGKRSNPCTASFSAYVCSKTIDSIGFREKSPILSQSGQNKTSHCYTHVFHISQKVFHRRFGSPFAACFCPYGCPVSRRYSPSPSASAQAIFCW